ncbi:formylglycine-generating enzyme family protein [Candidatus Uabimicrobium sp. HlEnr_7]|uniref:formylglycine-generating enzyme family protein n=1 Tax=Candidatus Uabimicrobium helgolandensis TaxID=3095367 RepID=UPI003558FE0E
MTTEKSSIQHKSTSIGRADLVEFLFYGERYLKKMSAFAGFESIQIENEQEEEPIELGKSPSKPDGEGSDIDVNEKPPSQSEKMRFWRAIKYESKEHESVVNVEEPEWTKGEILDTKKGGMNYDKTPPKQYPLVSWPKLWPFLQSVLGATYQRGIDVKKLIKIVSEIKPIYRVPKKSYRSWANTCHIVFDFDERLLTFWDDMNFIYEGIEQLRGSSGLEAYCVENGLLTKFKKYRRYREKAESFITPQVNEPLLIISDLGCLEPTEEKSVAEPVQESDYSNKQMRDVVIEKWLRFGKRLKKKGKKAIVLTPCPPRLWDSRLFSYFNLFWWDRGQRLPFDHRCSLSTSTANPHNGVDLLLSLLSPAVRIEPSLLRAARLLLHKYTDSGVEAQVWNHPHVEQNPLAFSYKESHFDTYRKNFACEGELVPEIQKIIEEYRMPVIKIIKEHHAYLPEGVRQEEEWLYEDLLNEEKEETQEYIKKIFRTMDSDNFDYREGFKQWFHRVSSRQHKEMWDNEALLATWFSNHRELWEQGSKLPVKEGMDLDKIKWLINKKETPAKKYALIHKGNVFVVESENIEQPFSMGSPVIDLTANTYLEQIYDDGLKYAHNLAHACEIQIPQQGGFSIETDCEKVVFKSVEKPSVAIAMGRDRYGLFSDYIVQGVRFRMRWINPGKFMMGSPESEVNRRDDEVHHTVILSSGFWLADTACTQELWQAIMKDNPSRSKETQLPVETVSWDDCNTFIDKMSSLLPECNFSLPTEAQWEYACRSGIQTAFSFGENITQEQVNYNSEQAVEVKSLPCNNWGLYEMHGNVFEWCYDWYDDYQVGSVVDPTGPNDGSGRVIRGGSWGYNSPRLVRSAYRDRYEPGSRVDDIGFRFCLRSQEK